MLLDENQILLGKISITDLNNFQNKSHASIQKYYRRV